MRPELRRPGADAAAAQGAPAQCLRPHAVQRLLVLVRRQSNPRGSKLWARPVARA